MNHDLTRILCASLLALCMTSAFAAPSTPEPQDKLDAVRVQIAAKQWDRAIEELRRVDDTSSAEWNNLMGYSLRKAKTPDLDASEKFYDDALRIDPRHRGTLEYSGELYLMKGNLAMAEKRLAALDKICASPCSEYTNLKKAIARYKAAGNKSASPGY